ncbi:hypothetical protein, partial [Gluconobacter potus]|uniref:hypothetical protein n=1 Tax=Gluconobacter potus TaxID=2724927 RepID=UPI001D1717A2
TPVRRTVAGGLRLAHDTQLPDWFHAVNPLSRHLCNKAPETLNQSAKKLKSSDKRINKQFFDPSTSKSTVRENASS